MPENIFCPRCDTLLLEAPQCPKCGWKCLARPPGQDKRLLWETRCKAGVSSGLTLGNGWLLFVDGMGKLHALDTGSLEEIWEQPVELGAWRIYEQMAVQDDMVVLGAIDMAPLPENDKGVTALDLNTGQVRWRQPLHERHVFDPVIDGGRAFVATASGQAVALDLDTGKPLWRQSIGGVFRAAPAVAAGLVYFGSDEGRITALRQEDAAVAWAYQVDAYGSLPESIRYTPAVADGVVYVTCWNRKTYALDAQTGQVIWISEPTRKRPPMSAPLVTGDRVYFVAHDRYVYALDRATGAGVWQTQLPRRSEVMPLLVDDVLYVLARDHNIYGLDAATGAVQEAPIFTTGGKVEKAWAFDGQTLYVVDDLGKLYALQLVQRPEEALAPERLAAAGQWEEAAVSWALQGEFGRAATIYAQRLQQPFRAAQLYEKAGEPLLAAQQYELAGDLKEARERYLQAEEWRKVAELSEQFGDLLGAAQAYEQAGALSKAGECYFKLKKYPQAVALYEEAAFQAREQGRQQQADQFLDWAVKMYIEHLGQPVKAVRLLNQFGRREEATELLQTIPGWKKEARLRNILKEIWRSPADRARLYEKSGALLMAAREYMEAGEHARAADLLAQTGEYTLAAEEYKLANMPAKAAAMMVRNENWDEAAVLYLQANRLQDALQAYLKAGDDRHAAELFQQLGQWHRAAPHWQRLGLWEQAALAWEQAEDYEQAARAWLQEGDSMAAARNFEAAAMAVLKQDHSATEAIASFYELAMQQYELSGVQNKAHFCDSRRRYFRKQPFIQINALHLSQGLRINEWGKLDVIIANQGWGQARDIRIQVAAQNFQLDTSRLAKLPGLGVGIQTKYTLWLKPLASGDAVPLHLTVNYLDWKSQPMPELVFDTDIKVHATESKTFTPQVINVHGDFIRADQVQKQVGDRVDIRREGRGVSLNSGEPAARHSPPATRHPPPAAPTITCPYCGVEQPATNPRCENPRCAQPFIQCPNCGLHQPYNEREPEQFCMFCGERI